jgi:hypothetical protein
VAHSVAVVFVTQVNPEHMVVAMVPPDAQAFAASLAMVALYVDAVPGTPSGSVQSV